MINKETIAYIFLLFIAFIWGITFTVVKNAISHIDIFVFLFQRFFLAFLLFMPFVFYFKDKLSILTLKHGTILGIVLFWAYAFQTIGLKYTFASNACFVTGLNVVLVPLINSVFFKDNVPLNAKLGSLLASIGIYILCIRENFYINKGDIIVFLCAICIALHIILTGKYTKYHNAFNLAFVQMGVICLLSGIWASFTGHAKELATIQPNTIWALIICSVFASNLAFWGQTYFQRFTIPTKTAIIFTGEPVFGALYAHFIGGEILGPRGIIGGVVIVSSMIISEINFFKKEYVTTKT